jgi:hypothetical protein
MLLAAVMWCTMINLQSCEWAPWARLFLPDAIVKLAMGAEMAVVSLGLPALASSVEK